MFIALVTCVQGYVRFQDRDENITASSKTSCCIKWLMSKNYCARYTTAWDLVMTLKIFVDVATLKQFWYLLSKPKYKFEEIVF